METSSNNSTRSDLTSADNTTLFILNASAHFPIKLKPTNYIAWRLQFLTAITRYNLKSFIDGSSTIPEKKLPEKSETNPAYESWFRQDQLLLNSIVASCTEEVVSTIQTATTAAQAWNLLEDTFANQSCSRIMSLKERIISTIKGFRSMTDFIKVMKSYFDDLMLTSDPMSKGDFLLHLLNGAETDYENIAGALRVRDKPLTFGDVRDRLLDHELIINKRETLLESAVATANYTKRV